MMCLSKGRFINIDGRPKGGRGNIRSIVDAPQKLLFCVSFLVMNIHTKLYINKGAFTFFFIALVQNGFLCCSFKTEILVPPKNNKKRWIRDRDRDRSADFSVPFKE